MVTWVGVGGKSSSFPLYYIGKNSVFSQGSQLCKTDSQQDALLDLYKPRPCLGLTAIYTK